MYGINLQLFNSKLRISIFDNLPKNLHFAYNLPFGANCAKKLPKTKISFHAQLSQKYFRFCANCAKKLAQNSLRFMRKSSQKKFAQK